MEIDDCPVLLAARLLCTGLKKRFRQLFQEQRYAISTTNYCFCGLGCERVGTGNLSHERVRFVAVQALELERRHVRPAKPEWLIAGAAGYDEQQWELRHSLDQHVEQLA